MKLLALFLSFIFALMLLKGIKAGDEELPVINASILFVPYYYVIVSEKLSEGIFFTNETGAVENVQYPLTAGTTNNNAIWNYNKSSGKTEYWIYFDGDVNGDICHGATNHLCSTPGCSGEGNVQINISNAKWSSSSRNDLYNPSLSNAVPFVIGFDNTHKVFSNLKPKSFVYLRYWLDVPPATPASNFNTTYQLRVVMEGESCV
ncbi:MAG: hypothetical protein QW451_02540 [Candidatus Aenigmatarchaeota archaeon]